MRPALNIIFNLQRIFMRSKVDSKYSFAVEENL